MTVADTYLENHDGCAFADNKAPAVGIKGTRCLLRSIIKAGGQAPRSRKTADGQGVNARLGSAGNHHVRFARSDESGRITDGVCTGGASGCGCMVWTLVMSATIAQIAADR